jgi:hypothetical protein
VFFITGNCDSTKAEFHSTDLGRRSHFTGSSLALRSRRTPISDCHDGNHSSYVAMPQITLITPRQQNPFMLPSRQKRLSCLDQPINPCLQF